MKKVLLFCLSIGMFIASCERAEDDVDNYYNYITISSESHITISYYKGGEEFKEDYPFDILLAKTRKGKDIVLFTSVDSAIIYNDNNEFVVSKKGDFSTRNILKQENYRKLGKEEYGASYYSYYIDSTYFTNSNYVNPQLIDNQYQ